MSRTKSITPGLATRFGVVRGYFIDHGVKQYMPVFSAIDADLDAHADVIRLWWNSRAALEQQHEPILRRMERVVEVLRNAKAA